MKILFKVICIWFAILFVLCLYIQSAHSQEVDKPIDYSWTNGQIEREIAAVTLLTIDFGQTREIPYCKCTEQNRIIGRYPTEKRVNTYFGVAIPAQIILVNVLPTKYREYLIDGTIAVELIETVHNHHVGITIRF